MTWSLVLFMGMFFIFIAIPVAAVAWRLILRLFEQSPRENEDEVRMMQEIGRGLHRLEDRVEALETLLADREHTRV